MKKKFSIATSLAVILALTLTLLVLAAQPAHVIFTAEAPCVVKVNLFSYTDPANQHVTNKNEPTPLQLDTFPSTPIIFGYPVSIICSEITYNLVSVTISPPVPPGEPFKSGAEGDTTYVTASYTSPIPNPDTTPPVIDSHADVGPIEATGSGGAVVTYASPATHDAVDGNGTATCVPASGSLFALGDTIVKCDAVDSAGNHAVQTSFVVHVVDTTSPTITFVSRLPVANSFGWNNSDVTVNWSCSDNVGVLSPTVTQVVSGEGSSLSVTGTCTDTSGNTTPDTQTGINIDKTAPSLSPAVSPNPAILNGSATVSANASDGLSGLDMVNCGALDTSSVGSKSVTCTATDKAGNSNSASINYGVQYANAGTKCKGVPGHEILQPINLDGSSVFKAGSTVPAKFRVCGEDGISIGTDGVVTSFRLIQIISNGIETNVDEAVLSTTPDDVFRSGNQQWVFNINTKNLAADNTYIYLITLNDGSFIEFRFTLK